MSFLDRFKKPSLPKWDPTHRGTINGVTMDEIREVLGRPMKTENGFTFWAARLSAIDPDYPDEEFFQLSNYNWRYGKDQEPSADREQWYIYATDPRTIRIVADEVGGMARGIEEV